MFVLSFDVGSDIARKNPWAGLEAFRRAFPGHEDVQLVIKTKPPSRFAAHRAQVEKLKSLARGDARIQVVERSLTYKEVLQLYASADVMLSLHRSEGLGLHLMEAMSLGKVVVATNWSGNTEFMNPRNSVSVGYRLVPVATEHLAYRAELGRPGQVWAEPDVDDAAAALRRLHEDPPARAALGGKAASDMEERRRIVLAGRAFDTLEEILRRGTQRRRFAWALRGTKARVIAMVLGDKLRALARLPKIST